MNKVFLIGNLTKDIELKTSQNGISFCKFTIAINRRVKDENEVDFIGITAWRTTAENCAKYLKKGNKVAIDGSIKTGSYEKDGQQIYTTDVVAYSVEFLNTINNKENKIPEMEPINEELPF